jgi:hypothetical protein
MRAMRTVFSLRDRDIQKKTELAADFPAAASIAQWPASGFTYVF